MIDLKLIRAVKGCEKCITRTALDSSHCDLCLRLIVAEVLEQAARIMEDVHGVGQSALTSTAAALRQAASGNSDDPHTSDKR